MKVLEQYYDGYRFAPEAPARVFNSDMVLYFLQRVSRERAYPADPKPPKAPTKKPTRSSRKPAAAAATRKRTSGRSR